MRTLRCITLSEFVTKTFALFATHDEDQERSRKQDGRYLACKNRKNEKPDSQGHLDGLQNAKVGHQHRRKTGTLHKMQDMVLQEEDPLND